LLLEDWKAGRLDKAVPNLPIFQPSKRITGFDRQKRFHYPTRGDRQLEVKIWQKSNRWDELTSRK
jgi:hypothetical protein